MLKGGLQPSCPPEEKVKAADAQRVDTINQGDSHSWELATCWDTDECVPSINDVFVFVLRQTETQCTVWCADFCRTSHHVEDGVLTVRLPEEVSDALTRGSYEYALQVSSPITNKSCTVETGYLYVEMSAASPGAISSLDDNDDDTLTAGSSSATFIVDAAILATGLLYFDPPLIMGAVLLFINGLLQPDCYIVPEGGAAVFLDAALRAELVLGEQITVINIT